MALENGTYQVKTEKTVTHWPAPDKDGDGDEVWVDAKDQYGQVVGRNKGTDEQGNVLREYLPPKGFENRPSYDNTDNYVRVDNRGRVLRDINGNAMSIRPGTTLVENADGTSVVLTDDYSRYQFELAHNKVGTTSEVPA